MKNGNQIAKMLRLLTLLLVVFAFVACTPEEENLDPDPKPVPPVVTPLTDDEIAAIGYVNPLDKNKAPTIFEYMPYTPTDLAGVVQAFRDMDWNAKHVKYQFGNYYDPFFAYVGYTVNGYIFPNSSHGAMLFVDKPQDSIYVNTYSTGGPFIRFRIIAIGLNPDSNGKPVIIQSPEISLYHLDGTAIPNTEGMMHPAISKDKIFGNALATGNEWLFAMKIIEVENGGTHYYDQEALDQRFGVKKRINTVLAMDLNGGTESPSLVY